MILINGVKNVNTRFGRNKGGFTMSGSSFEYLCHKEEERLFTSHTLYWMKAMYRQLFELEFNDVAWDTKKLRVNYPPPDPDGY